MIQANTTSWASPDSKPRLNGSKDMTRKLGVTLLPSTGYSIDLSIVVLPIGALR